MEIKALDHIITRAMTHDLFPLQRKSQEKNHLKCIYLCDIPNRLTEQEAQEKLAASTSRVSVK